jgi:hypothetical protein
MTSTTTEPATETIADKPVEAGAGGAAAVLDAELARRLVAQAKAAGVWLPGRGGVAAGRHTGGEGGVATWPSKLGRSETRRRRDRLRKHRQGAPESAAAARGVSIGSCGRYRSWSRRRVR